MTPGLFLRITGAHFPDPVMALLFGVAIIGAAFWLSWAAEVAQLDFSAGLALAGLALIAVLPEYIVDGTFAFLAASHPEYAQYAVANMTGANRLLIGLAWPMVVLLPFLRFRRKAVTLDPEQHLELALLLVALVYAMTVVLRREVSLLDSVVFAAIFVFYVWRVARRPSEPPHLVGPALLLTALEPLQRRLGMSVLAFVAAGAIIAVAEPFAEALIHSGTTLGIDEFLLVQWLAPLASEAPEFTVVAIFAWRGLGTLALGALVSSKINQWTLLVGMLPLAYSVGLGEPAPLSLDLRQQEEVMLTAAQSVFAISLLTNLRLSLLGAGGLFGLFVLQMLVPDLRTIVTWAYFGGAVAMFAVHRRHLPTAVRSLGG
ncbi:MAG: sodium:calcium antiporter [Dehalococcoidia bacterium]|nr:sodium:calcium antiporter [Dehalococcoidia bacterium]